MPCCIWPTCPLSLLWSTIVSAFLFVFSQPGGRLERPWVWFCLLFSHGQTGCMMGLGMSAPGCSALVALHCHYWGGITEEVGLGPLVKVASARSPTSSLLFLSTLHSWEVSPPAQLPLKGQGIHPTPGMGSICMFICDSSVWETRLLSPLARVNSHYLTLVCVTI